MPFSADYDKAGFISVAYHGEATMEGMIELIACGTRLAKEWNCFLVLSDYRAMKLELSISALYDLPNQLVLQAQKMGLSPYKFKRALVVPVEKLEPYKFFELVSSNRAHLLKVFTDMEQARAWLLAGD